MLGIIDVGGGVRDSFGAGILDYCMKAGLQFDYCTGVSAGSANLCSYLARQPRRNYRFYTKYCFRKEYMSFRHFIRHHNYVNLDYIYSTLSHTDGEDPMDFQTMASSGIPLNIVATDAVTGKPVYFTMADITENDYSPIMGSSCVPVVNTPYPVHGTLCYDGGISDPIPWEKAYADGCDHIVLILTRPKDAFRKSKTDKTLSTFIKKTFPASADALAHRADTYNRQLQGALACEKEGRMTILAPESIYGMKTLTKDVRLIKRLYRDGFLQAQKKLPEVFETYGRKK